MQVVYFARGGDPFGTQLPDKFAFKNHFGVNVYLLNSLLLGTSSHGYVKDILRVLGYNNFFTNIGIALFNMTNIYVNTSLGDR